ncbi:MAG: hypothetical protein JW951_00305 [Lentisphaerae bacterium]|nr:hypothetical protein [Lentisphaerota bacterium]
MTRDAPVKVVVDDGVRLADDDLAAIKGLCVRYNPKGIIEEVVSTKPTCWAEEAEAIVSFMPHDESHGLSRSKWMACTKGERGWTAYHYMLDREIAVLTRPGTTNTFEVTSTVDTETVMGLIENLDGQSISPAMVCGIDKVEDCFEVELATGKNLPPQFLYFTRSGGGWRRLRTEEGLLHTKPQRDDHFRFALEQEHEIVESHPRGLMDLPRSYCVLYTCVESATGKRRVVCGATRWLLGLISWSHGLRASTNSQSELVAVALAATNRVFMSVLQTNGFFMGQSEGAYARQVTHSVLDSLVDEALMDTEVRARAVREIEGRLRVLPESDYARALTERGFLVLDSYGEMIVTKYKTNELRQLSQGIDPFAEDGKRGVGGE